MISVEFVRTMARYNRWQNRSLYAAADTLSSEERRKDRGAFFGSIEGTLNHLLWGDMMWLHRFAETRFKRFATRRLNATVSTTQCGVQTLKRGTRLFQVFFAVVQLAAIVAGHQEVANGFGIVIFQHVTHGEEIAK